MRSFLRGGAWSSAVVVVPAIWGYNWVVMKQGLAYSGPFAFAAWRYALGALILFVALVATRRPLAIRSFGTVVWIGLTQTASNTLFNLLALRTGPAGRSAILSYTMPFFVLAIAWPVLKERPGRLQWIATSVALLGVALIFLSGIDRWRADAAVYSVLAGVTWAVGTVLARRLLSIERCDPLTLTAWQMLAAAIALGLAAAVVPERSTDWTPTFLVILAYEVVPATALAWLLWVGVLRRVDATVASFSLLGTPLIGLLSSAALLGERPTPLEAGGMALILVALTLVGPVAMRQASGEAAP